VGESARWIFCLGQMKAGTTWFYESSIRCPEVFTPPVKELRILSTFARHGILTLQEKMSSESFESVREFMDDRRNTFLEYPRVFIKQFADLYGAVGQKLLTKVSVDQFQWWLQYLAAPWTPQLFEQLSSGLTCKYVLDASPENVIVPHAVLTMLAKEIQRPKLVLLLRCPLRRILSHLWMFHEWRPVLASGSEDAIRALLASSKEQERLQTAVKHTCVLEGISRWRKIFGDESIFIIVLDEMQEYGAPIQEALEEFLEVDSFPLLEAKINRSREASFSKAWREKLAPTAASVREKLKLELHIDLPDEEESTVRISRSDMQSGRLDVRNPVPVRVLDVETVSRRICREWLDQLSIPIAL